MKNASLLTDGYKLDHRRQYPTGTEYVYSNWTPRSNRHYPSAKGAVVFGSQYVFKRINEYFKENFFNLPKDSVVADYERRLKTFLGHVASEQIGTQHIEDLHDLGYLPIEVRSLPEGTICPIGVPALTIINTNPKFFWITNFLETIISNELWLPMTSATTAHLYKQELIRHAKKTGFYSEEAIAFLCHDFSMRGMAGLDASIQSGMAHLISFSGSETIPAIDALEEYYNANAEKELVAGTVPATEHSVMCAGGKDDELETFRRILADLYPNGYCSIVSDTWDFWTVVSEYIPKLHDVIMARDGRFVVRPDSGDPVKIITGHIDLTEQFKNAYQGNIGNIDISQLSSASYCYQKGIDNIIESLKKMCVDGDWYVKFGNLYFTENKKVQYNPINFLPIHTFVKIEDNKIPEIKGVYECLWDEFGGDINENGYKILDTHVGVIYGDSITYKRQQDIYDRLEKKGFAASNLVLGIGSYTYNYVTRDALGFAMKATWCQVNGEGREIYKDPQTVTGMTKKSLKGLIGVYSGTGGVLYAKDQIPYEEWVNDEKTKLQVIFKDGLFTKETSLAEIRETLLNQ